jgi:mannose-6-phosphate isomerase-like protein (cupin superfamily)
MALARRKQRRTHVHVPCMDLDAAMDFYTRQLAFRLDMIMPADAPRVAVLSGYGITLRLERVEATGLAIAPGPGHDGSDDRGSIRIHRISSAAGWGAGRAGMQYRDLVPGRMDGRFIASHIRIPDGGPVPDYVHYHRVDFQMIFCRRGWVRVVYEDQGPPFTMQSGDCVLQPPTIRHRVLEASPGLEVIEVGSPAEHETWRDHELSLPTPAVHSERIFGGQRFVRHVAADACWACLPSVGWASRETGIAVATGGQGGVRVLRSTRVPGSHAPDPMQAQDRMRFLFVLSGRLRLHVPGQVVRVLETDDACLIPATVEHALDTVTPCELLEVSLPACRS